MRSVLTASLRVHTRRYVAAAVAVVIGVAFIVVTSALSSAARDGLVSGVELPYRHADVVVSDIDGDQAARLIDGAHQRGDHASFLGWTMQQVRVDGRLVDESADVGAVADDAALRWQGLRSGRFPQRAGEAVADANAVKSDDVSVGDTIRVGTGNHAVEARVVGLVDTPSASVGADFYLTWADLRGFAGDLWVDSIAYAGSGSATLADRLPAEATVQARDTFVEERQKELTNEVNVLAILLLVFATIALFVSVLVVANTFSILFAQRTRDFALLRCVGATRRQVLRSVRVEALVIGVASAIIGLVAGTAVGYALVAISRAALPPGTMGAASPSLGWYAGAFVTGVLVTVVAAWLPTRRVTALDPLAALRPDDATNVRTRAGRMRVAGGAVTVAAGAALLGLSIAHNSVLAMLAGGVASFSGVLLLGPVLVPALIRVVGAVSGRLFGTPARLATENAVRNPRRTAATTAALLVGVTLTTAVLTGLASSRSAVDTDLDTDYPVDLALTATDRALPAGLLDQVRGLHGVAAAASLEGARVRMPRAGTLPVVAAPDAAPGTVVHGAPGFARPAPGEIWVPEDADLADGTRLSLSGPAGPVTLRVRSGSGWGDSAVVAPATLPRLATDPVPLAVWVRAAGGADVEDLAGDVDALAQPAHADLENNLATRAWVDLQLDILTGTVVALLGIAVVIALIGIGNTLGLSVLERGRENALLRALGLTRRQLRATLAAEALLLSVVATVVGTAIGVTFAWVSLQALVKAAVDEAPMVLPWGQLVLVVLVAGAAGLLSSLVPARRAARTAPAAGLSLD
jgi:putative ABC transport system permease protein